MFEKTLTDLVKGIRAQKRDTALYISQCIAEIKTEINSSDMYVKANALQKLTFLQMMGYSMSWASFATIEVMSSPRFAHKRIGYLAASQGFTQDTEVILLTTNLLKKELRGAVGGGMNGVYEAGLAINCISNIITADLAADLLPEVSNLLSHPQPYLRKKAILCIFKLFVKYPQGLRLTFTKLQQCLDDANSSVVSCAVNVITELSDKNPKNYLHLAPSFFQLLTSSSNNWMLIKVVKLLGSLVPEEPRLARKLLEPLAAIVQKTQAKSLLYEAVHTITLCLPYCRKSDGTMPANVPDIVELCAKTLRELVEDDDQNLKYLGLVGFGSLMQSHPQILSGSGYRPLILACLSDQDVTIRTRALDLLKGLVTRKNLVELVTQLLKHVELATGNYKCDLVAKIIAMCSGEKFALLQDFAWYLDILFRLGHVRGLDIHANLLRGQITDVALRVLPVRKYAVRRSMEVLLEKVGTVSDDPHGDNGRGKHIMPEILPAFAWIIGEYSDLIREAIASEDNAEQLLFDEESLGTYHSLIQVLTNPWNTTKLPTATQKIYVQNAMKVFAAASMDKGVKETQLDACLDTLHRNLPVYTQSINVEVLERSITALRLLDSLGLSGNGVPSLITADDGSVSDDDPSDDLLNLQMKQKNIKEKKTDRMKLPSSLPEKIRAAAATLNDLLKPSPMKPSGTKAQKKKHQAPSGLSLDIEKAIDLSVLSDLIEEESSSRSGSKLSSVEVVNFTEQRPLQVEERKSIVQLNIDSVSSDNMQYHADIDPSTSFRHTAGTSILPVSRARQGDPFYLDSAQPSDDEKDETAANRFGTIQLLDSDEEKHVESPKKKKKLKKTSKKAQSGVSDRDHTFSTGAQSKSGLPGISLDEMAIYNSDDEEDETSAKLHRKSRGNEFDGLAKVDLTTPLREDEVMPERRHRVVPERVLGKNNKEPEPKSKKKRKKEKKKSTKKEKVTQSTADLLDLGNNFSQPPSVPIATEQVASNGATPTNPISSVFDDLLSTSASIASTGIAKSSTDFSWQDIDSQIQPSEQKGSTRPWMKATIKTSTASGDFDWSSFLLSYQVYRTSGHAASLVFRAKNTDSFTTITGLSLDLKELGTITFDEVSPGGTSLSSKAGPFPVGGDNPSEYKGKLLSSGSSVAVKFLIPSTLELNPQEGISLEDVVEEFAQQYWSSNSAKITYTGNLSVSFVKESVCSFFRAAEVNCSSDGMNATFASLSSTGIRVRVLMKIKDNAVKVDVKSTDGALSERLASDFKKLLL